MPPVDWSSCALVVGPADEERRQTEERLRQINCPAVGATLDEIAALPELDTPRLVVFDAGSGRAERRRAQSQIRRHPKLRHVALLVLGDGADLLTLTMAVGHGASAYLPRRASDEILASVVSKLQRVAGDPPAVEQRRHPRRPLLVPVEIEVVNGAGRATAWLMDASAAGCCIETAASIKKGDGIRLWLPLAEATAHQPLTGQARWVRSASANQALAGIQLASDAAFMAGLALGIDAD
jgi:hypothetical protein